MSFSTEFPEFEVPGFKDPILDLAIDHPLWQGLKVTLVKDDPESKVANVAKIFFDLNRIKIGEGCYVNPDENRFIDFWKDFKASGKTITEYQRDVLKNRESRAPLEAKIAAAVQLAGNQGYQDAELVVKKGWHGAAEKIAVLYMDKKEEIGAGGFGVISQADGFIVTPNQKSYFEKAFALKAPRGTFANECFRKGNSLLETLWEGKRPDDLCGVVKPSLEINLTDRNGEPISLWAMSGYSGDLWKASELYRESHPEKLLEGFETAFKGLGILHDNGIVHVDLKPENLLFKERTHKTCFEINDFDDCFSIPSPEEFFAFSEKQRLAFGDTLKNFMLPHTWCYTKGVEIYFLSEALRHLGDLINTPESEELEISDCLDVCRNLVKGIQIYQMGWTLLGTLTGTSPTEFLPSLNLDGESDGAGSIYSPSLKDTYTETYGGQVSGTVTPSSFDQTVTLPTDGTPFQIPKDKEAFRRFLNDVIEKNEPVSTKEQTPPRIQELFEATSLSPFQKAELVDICTRMLDYRPLERPTVQEIQALIDRLSGKTFQMEGSLDGGSKICYSSGFSISLGYHDGCPSLPFSSKSIVGKSFRGRA